MMIATGRGMVMGMTRMGGRRKLDTDYTDMMVDFTTITIGRPQCEHLNGAYRTIPARWFGRREVFVCADCESVLDAKTKEKV